MTSHEKHTTLTKHKTVLINEVLEYLVYKPGNIYLDVTLGGGGHTRAILQADPTCKVIGIDWDFNELERQTEQLKAEFGDRFTGIWGNFAGLYRLIKKHKIPKVDGILADFGTSQMQIHHKAGFSFLQDTPLDMRMSSAHNLLTAADIINQYSEKDLTTLFFTYGEEPHARAIARAIAAARVTKKITSTKELAEIVERVVLRTMTKDKRLHHHPATRVFQALRIEVNKELENIKLFLPIALSQLNVRGRLVCISFHSLEDRIVKNFFQDHRPELKILTTKPITADDAELSTNPSSRSAKLRAAEKI